jgi:hypothetical protein
VGYDRGEVMEAIENQIHNGRYPQDRLYGDGRAGERIAEHLAEVPLSIEKRLMY